MAHIISAACSFACTRPSDPSPSVATGSRTMSAWARCAQASTRRRRSGPQRVSASESTIHSVSAALTPVVMAAFLPSPALGNRRNPGQRGIIARTFSAVPSVLPSSTTITWTGRCGCSCTYRSCNSGTMVSAPSRTGTMCATDGAASSEGGASASRTACATVSRQPLSTDAKSTARPKHRSRRTVISIRLRMCLCGCGPPGG